MKTSECDILIMPGTALLDPGHWLSRWENRLPTARRPAGIGDGIIDRERWVTALRNEVKAATRPVVIVAHSLGVLATVHAAQQFRRGAVRGAFLVAPDDIVGADLADDIRESFGPTPAAPLPFPAMLVASRTDPGCAYKVADEMAADWGALIVDAGDSGRIDVASGHGPWPEGLTRFATLLSRL